MSAPFPDGPPAGDTHRQIIAAARRTERAEGRTSGARFAETRQPGSVAGRSATAGMQKRDRLRVSKGSTLGVLLGGVKWLVDRMGLEPTTSALRTRRSPS